MKSNSSRFRADSKILKQPYPRLLRSKSHFFFRPSNSVQPPRKNTFRLSPKIEGRVKNTNFSTCLFNQAHKIDPVKQSYLPTPAETPRNKTKVPKIVISRQKQQQTRKVRELSKTKSLIWNRSDTTAENTKIQKNSSKIVAPLSSLTLLIMNECKIQLEETKTMQKKGRLTKYLSTDHCSKKCQKKKKQHKQRNSENPYDLLPLRKSKRGNEVRLK